MGFLRRHYLLLVLLWIVLLGLALLVDRHVAQWVHDTVPINKHGWIARSVRLPGNYFFVVVAALLLALSPRRKWAAALPVFLTGPLVGATYIWIKWLVGRRRPVLEIAPFSFHPLMHGIVGLFKSVSGLSFPSGDATMAFAAAACFALALPRWTAAFFGWALLVAIERVLENAHYVSDVVAGAGLGMICGYLAVVVSKKILREPVNPREPLDVGRTPPAKDRAAGSARPTLANHG